MEFILASSNTHKAQELDSILSAGNLKITSASEKLEVVEDGLTFQENAFKKAKAYFDKFQKPTLADDSGLVFPAREEILGIHSARYAPHLENYKDKNEYLLEDIKNLKGGDRKAHFACYLCFYISEDEVYFFEGRVHGRIGDEAQGADGFGYDPIFLPDGQQGKSLAEISEWKMLNSHRAKACAAAIKFFKAQK
jgi:XTP/dITP diphosphohydrolase